MKTFDVVIAEETVEHDYTERFDPAPSPSFSGCNEAISHLMGKVGGLGLSFVVHRGRIASGARASVFNGKPYSEIRGITDVADNDAPIDFRTNLQKSMANVALVLKAMLR